MKCDIYFSLYRNYWEIWVIGRVRVIIEIMLHQKLDTPNEFDDELWSAESSQNM